MNSQLAVLGGVDAGFRAGPQVLLVSCLLWLVSMAPLAIALIGLANLAWYGGLPTTGERVLELLVGALGVLAALLWQSGVTGALVRRLVHPAGDTPFDWAVATRRGVLCAADVMRAQVRRWVICALACVPFGLGLPLARAHTAAWPVRAVLTPEVPVSPRSGWFDARAIAIDATAFLLGVVAFLNGVLVLTWLDGQMLWTPFVEGAVPSVTALSALVLAWTLSEGWRWLALVRLVAADIVDEEAA